MISGMTNVIIVPEQNLHHGMQVPMGATIVCQLLQMRTHTVLDMDLQSANSWRWRPSYEGIQLADCK